MSATKQRHCRQLDQRNAAPICRRGRFWLLSSSSVSKIPRRRLPRLISGNPTQSSRLNSAALPRPALPSFLDTTVAGMPPPGNEYAAEQLKNAGNKCFKNGEYEQAEALYSQAVQKNSNNPLLFTNRANARLKLEKWEGVIDDCIRSIELLKDNMKAFFYLGRPRLLLLLLLLLLLAWASRR
jgi:tetratricopeptide (TPR) repeat protein